MIDYEGTRKAVVKGLKAYLGVPVVRTNQSAEMPKYPFVSYTVTTLMSENKGTYGEYEDGYARKPVTSIWSITAQSKDNAESVNLAVKAREWLDFVGTLELNDSNVIVQSVGSVTNRDNVLTVGYEYKNGFDVVFWLFDEVENPNGRQTIEVMAFGDDSNARLENRLDGVSDSTYGLTQAEEDAALNDALSKRLDGV